MDDLLKAALEDVDDKWAATEKLFQHFAVAPTSKVARLWKVGNKHPQKSFIREAIYQASVASLLAGKIDIGPRGPLGAKLGAKFQRLDKAKQEEWKREVVEITDQMAAAVTAAGGFERFLPELDDAKVLARVRGSTLADTGLRAEQMSAALAKTSVMMTALGPVAQRYADKVPHLTPLQGRMKDILSMPEIASAHSIWLASIHEPKKLAQRVMSGVATLDELEVAGKLILSPAKRSPGGQADLETVRRNTMVVMQFMLTCHLYRWPPKIWLRTMEDAYGLKRRQAWTILEQFRLKAGGRAANPDADPLVK